MQERELEIRKVTKRDYPSVRLLEEYCFFGLEGYDSEGADLVLGYSGMMDNCYAAYCCDELVSMLTIFPFTMRYKNEWVPIGGISSVATLPENRCRGYVRTLIKDALERMRDAGQVFSVLSPFRYAFYKKYGWGWAFSSRTLKLQIEDFKKFGNKSCSFRLLKVEDYEDINRVYEIFVSTYNGPLKREDWDYRERWAKKE